MAEPAASRAPVKRAEPVQEPMVRGPAVAARTLAVRPPAEIPQVLFLSPAQTEVQARQGLPGARWWTTYIYTGPRLTWLRRGGSGDVSSGAAANGGAGGAGTEWDASHGSGGGGGGAGISTASGPIPSGGGGGAYSIISNVSLTPGASVTYAVGLGGANVSGNSGNPGGNTYFCNSSSNCASISGSAVIVGLWRRPGLGRRRFKRNNDSRRRRPRVRSLNDL